MPPEAHTSESAIWRRPWFQWMIAVLVGCGIAAFLLPPVLAVVYAARSVLLPVVLAVVLAYIFNPVVTLLQRRVKLPRWLGTAVVMLAAVGVVFVAMLLVVPPVVRQAGDLVTKVHTDWPQKLLEKLNSKPTPEAEAPAVEAAAAAISDTASEVTDEATDEAATTPGWWEKLVDTEQTHEWLAKASDALANLDWQKVWQFTLSSLDVGVGVAGAAISFTSYLALVTVVTAFCFFFFSWKFNDLGAWFVPFIPASVRERTLDVLGKMDKSVAAFIRGRLIQAMVMSVVLTIGWWIAGVPAFLLLGLASGFLNLVPFAAVVGCAVALGLNVIDDASGAGLTWWTVLGPVLVYVIAQSLDGWVVEPIVQGKATDLDPVTVLVVVMLGGAVAGLLGMVIAIPVAACVKIVSKEVLLPRLRGLAAAA